MTEKEDPPVTVNIGIMRYIEEENMLKPQRGKSLPLRIGRTADGEELLKLAVAKHSKHNANEITHSSPLAYKLLHPDGIEVNKLRESDQAFSLQEYKAELGKPYNRITFYPCSSSDYYDHSFKGFADTISDDGDDKNDSDKDSEDLSEPTQTKITKYTDTGFAKTTRTVKASDANSVSVKPGSYIATSLSDPFTTSDIPTSLLGSSSSGSYSTTACNSSGFETLEEIFPQLPEKKIFDVFSSSQDIETAIATLCENANGGLHDSLRSYASVIDVDFSNDLYDSENDIIFGGEESEFSKTDESAEHEIEDQQSLCEKLKELFQKCSNSGKKIRLKVRRSCLWEDTLAKIKRINHDCLNGIVTVQFIGEPAVDEGGPRKEFFFLVHKHMQQS